MIQHIAEQLRRAFEGGAWHGPAVFELLDPLDAATAARRPAPGRPSIHGLSLHITAWLDAVRRRLGGEAVTLTGDTDFPPVADDQPATWDATRTSLRDRHLALQRAILALTPAQLEAKVPGKDYTAHFMLDGVIQHSLYHAGQIALLCKLVPRTDREFLRHTLGTLAYRASKAVRGAPAHFADFQAGPTSRTPVQILAHMGDLFDWALSIAQGAQKWNDATPRPWPDECTRFFAALKRFDDHLASDAALHGGRERLFQGPIADALTHTGQLTMLRRLAEAPIKGESYLVADIQTGRVGTEQTPPRREFD
ncbi:MAG: DinB family protein [Planctomycetota bacterium]